MVQLKSFRYVEQDQTQDDYPASSNDVATAGTSDSSIVSTIGGNLTSNSSQDAESDLISRKSRRDGAKLSEERRSHSTLLSNEEYQSAVHDMSDKFEDYDESEDEGEDGGEGEEENKNIALDPDKSLVEQQSNLNGQADLKRGKLEDIAKQRAAAANVKSDDVVTRINIERGSITNINETPPHSAVAGSHAVPANTSRINLHMHRSHTSPALSQLAMTNGGSPVVPLRQAITSNWWLAGKRVQSGDNMSQYSFGTQKNYSNHFEIRWQNVRLFARQNSRVPKFISESTLYQQFVRSSDSDANSLRAEYCYSPPVQHKGIPATINELQESHGSTDGIGYSDKPISEPQESNGRCILDNISGQVFSGQMTAILGPSGVGKTTLLNSLTGRNTLNGTGRVSLIGASARKRMAVVTVPQVDVLPGKLTVWEDLMFTSRLKMPEGDFDHVHNIARIVKHLHMDKFVHTRIDKLSGGEQRRLSIARELLSSPDIMILDEPTSGLDANTCKKIITALRDIVEHSDNILDKPMSMLVTIHQPQQEVYNLFHRVYVMAVGGRAVYEGPPGLLLPTLLEQSSLGRAVQPDQLNENPAIVAIEVASGEYGPHVIDELAKHHEEHLYEEFSSPSVFALNGQTDYEAPTGSPMQTPRTLRSPIRSPLSVSRAELGHRKRLNSAGESSIGRPTPILTKRQLANLNQIDKVSSITSFSYASTYDAELPEVTSKLKVDKKLRRSVVMKSSLLRHTWTLMQRCWLLATRDMFLMSIRILGFLLVAAGTVQIFSNALDPNEHQCPKYESEVDNVIEYITSVKQRLMGLEPMLKQSNAVHMFFFHILLCITMVTSALSGLVFPMQMRMFMREYKNGWYSPASFILSQTLAELPVDIIGPLITLLITYPLCNQPVSAYYWREIGYALVLIGCSIICKSQAQIVGAILMDSVENSVFISCVCVVGPALTSGVPIRISQMPKPLQIISYFSFLRYGFESLLALRYGYDMCPCDPQLVYGYPVNATDRAVPLQLNNFARGIMALNQPNNQTGPTLFNGESTTAPLISTQSLNKGHDNIIVNFIRLITDAGNLMVNNAEELGECDKYRSLYLLAMDIPNDILPKWLITMLVMFIISRFLTYFIVKAVIRFRRS